MKVMQKILITIAMVIGLSLAVSAQKDDPKKPPPKPTPPVVNPGPKNPPKPDKPKPDKPDKPEFEAVIWKSEAGNLA